MQRIFHPIMLSCITVMVFSGRSTDQISFIKHDGKIDIVNNGRLITTYQYGDHLSKPILFPVMSPSGEMITRSYPFTEVTGESHDHPHHTGISFTYGSNGEVNGNSFWANAHDKPPLTMATKLPQIRHVDIPEMTTSKNTARMGAISHWIDKNNQALLREERIMEFVVEKDAYRIDFSIHLSPLDTVVHFEDTKEGMFAIRVADWLAEDANGTLFESTGEYLNAEGEKTEQNIWAKRSAWVRLEGEKDEQKIGIAIFHHPASINFPAYWHARGYGCFAANPLGQYDYQKGRGLQNPQKRQLILQPGESALFKFRVMIYDGGRTRQQLDEEFINFSGS
ncbi:MAG: PmoA family protein [Saprospiraceae bacterium]|nr:PmoA family protein [Saprospiraceae bacterium]